MTEKNRYKTGDEAEDIDVEEELTVDTPGPTAVEPPLEVVALETNAVAIPVDPNNDIDTTSSTGVGVDTSASASTSAWSANANASANTNASSTLTCTVYAPATLEPGYTFTANVDGINFVVTVPEGGVVEGQPFNVPYPQRSNVNNVASQSTLISPMEIDSTSSAAIAFAPTGRWRNHLFDCCEVFFSGLFWQGCFCTIMLLGQIMTRLRLDLCARPGEKHERAICILLFIWILFLILFFVLPDVFSFLIIPLAIYLTILVTKTRYAMRQKYNIPVSDCRDCDGQCNDCCLGFWCMCCVVIQMARHTHPERDYPYQCCSKTGLGQNAPGIV
jgi:Cys-rich protein (TIGR01571 family)